MKSLSGKVAAITGAGSGIGRELALGLARRGADLALSDVDERPLDVTRGLVTANTPSGTKITCERVDVSVRDEVYGWAERSAGEHGRVNLIFNNAGVAPGSTIEGATVRGFTDALQKILSAVERDRRRVLVGPCLRDRCSL